MKFTRSNQNQIQNRRHKVNESVETEMQLFSGIQ